jgi:hypothetical protein
VNSLEVVSSLILAASLLDSPSTESFSLFGLDPVQPTPEHRLEILHCMCLEGRNLGADSEIRELSRVDQGLLW